MADTRYHVLTLTQISSQGLHRLPNARYVCGKTLERPDAILVRSFDMRTMEIPASVKAIGRAGAGTNNIPVDAMSNRGVPVFNAPGANANAVKELVLAALLTAARNLIPALDYVAKLDAAAPNLEKSVEDAVIAALRARRLKYYLCDFPSAKLLHQPGVAALPHLGASTEEAEENCAVMVVDQVREYLENGAIANAVNFPNVDMPRESPYRVAIANANVPNMLGQISTTMAHAGLNIHNMVNKSRGEMAYTLVDVDSPIQPSVVDAISAIQGVLSVRAIPAQT